MKTKRIETAWFIEHLPKRGVPWIAPSTGASSRRSCMQAYLDACMNMWVSDVERKKAYDRWHERKRARAFRAVRVDIVWKAAR